MKYSDHIFYVGRNSYELWQLSRIAKELGGTEVVPGYEGEIGGVCLFANQVNSHHDERVVRVYVTHGTSNKNTVMLFGDQGKDRFDYYWTTGPKYRDILKAYGHCLDGKEVKIGNLRFDWYFQEYTKANVMKILKIKNSRKIVIFAPTFNLHTIEHCNSIMEPLLKKYNVVLKAHPLEKINLNRTHSRLYIYTGDIANILWAADILISDTSAVAYDFTITGKPIVLCQPIYASCFDDDDKYNLMKHTAIYHYFHPYKDDIMEKIEEAESRTDEVKQLCKDAFWYQDGYATDRACEWIRKIIDERFA